MEHNYQIIINDHNKYHHGHGLVKGTSMINFTEKVSNKNNHLTILSYMKTQNKGIKKFIKRSKSI